MLAHNEDSTVPHINFRNLLLEINEARAQHLVITHVLPWFGPSQHLVEARAVFESQVELAAIGRTFSNTNN